MANLPFTVDPDEILVERVEDYGPCEIGGSDGYIVAPGGLWHMRPEECDERPDWRPHVAAQTADKPKK